MNIKREILDGESVTQDFKNTINSCEKIARTLVAFANNRGGRLLVGVADDGEIKGVKSEEEEKYMLRKAAESYCHPPLQVSFREVEAEELTVLIAEVEESREKPHYAPDENGKWKVYVRIGDRSMLASKVVMDVLKKENSREGVLFTYSDKEKALLEYLNQHERITLPELCKLIKTNRKKTSRMLVDLILAGLIKVNTTEKNEYYSVK